MLKQHKRFTNMPAIILVISLLAVISESCNTTEPDNNNNGGNGTDTTSQNFTFETFEFGDGGSSSYFNDAWVFDENNIWAVGYISDDVSYNPNIIRWDGISWKLEQYPGTSSGIDGIWALDSSNIYFAIGAIVKYENGRYIETNLGHLGFTNGQRVQKLWGSSENNIWGVGPWGTVVHYDGVTWKKIEFDRQWYFYDITGNKETGIAYALARNQDHISNIVALENGTAKSIYSSQGDEPIYSSWSIHFQDGEIYLGDDNIWSFNIHASKEKLLQKLPTGIGVLTIGGFSKNDMYYSGWEGSGGRLIHYNGSRYTIFNLGVNTDSYGGAYAIKDFAVLVGSSNNRGYIIKIKRG